MVDLQLAFSMHRDTANFTGLPLFAEAPDGCLAW